MEELRKGFKCVRCSNSVSTKGGRCTSCKKTLRTAKKKPGTYQHEHKLADDALRRQEGKTKQSTKKTKGRGTRKSLIGQIRSAYKKHGKNTTLSPDRKSNSAGYGASNTRLVPKKLNRGRHNVDSKKLANWRDKVKKHDLEYEEFLTLLRARAQKNHDQELVKALEDMRPEDLQELIKKDDLKIKIMVIQGGTRDKGTCPGKDTKMKFIARKMKDVAPDYVEVDVLDLAVKGDGSDVIQRCKGCVGTSGGFHCHWKCSCYGPDSGSEDLPDLMHDQKVYDRLEQADGIMFLSPVHWFAESSGIKLMMDRLVCANMTLTKEQAKNIYNDDIKNPKLTKAAEESGRYESLLTNHLEGKYAAVYMQGDGGADDYKKHSMPKSMEGYEDELVGANGKEAYQSLVNQLRYSGIFVPQDLIKVVTRNYGNDYGKNDDTFKDDMDFIAGALDLFNNLLKTIEKNIK